MYPLKNTKLFRTIKNKFVLPWKKFLFTVKINKFGCLIKALKVCGNHKCFQIKYSYHFSSI